jgi:hypothetical protein
MIVAGHPLHADCACGVSQRCLFRVERCETASEWGFADGGLQVQRSLEGHQYGVSQRQTEIMLAARHRTTMSIQ